MKTSLIVFALSLSISGCNGSPKPDAGRHTDTNVQTVEVVAVASQRLETVLTLPAQLIPLETGDVYPKVTGFMDMIRVDRGTRVHKEDLIIRLSALELVAQRGITAFLG
jgi:membrane fusion protein (multidrug efflux system)